MTGMQPLSTLLLFNNSDSPPSTHYSTHEKELLDLLEASVPPPLLQRFISSHQQTAVVKHFTSQISNIMQNVGELDGL